MRIVGLDLGASHIEFCELKDGQARRQSVRRFGELKRLLGPGTEPARVAFEACREGWRVYDSLVEWGHEAVMLDTTRVRQNCLPQRLVAHAEDFHPRRKRFANTIEIWIAEQG